MYIVHILETSVLRIRELFGVLVDINKNKHKEIEMAKGVPKRDGSGSGQRANNGRGGCASPNSTGKSRNR